MRTIKEILEAPIDDKLIADLSKVHDEVLLGETDWGNYTSLVETLSITLAGLEPGKAYDVAEDNAREIAYDRVMIKLAEHQRNEAQQNLDEMVRTWGNQQ